MMKDIVAAALSASLLIAPVSVFAATAADSLGSGWQSHDTMHHAHKAPEPQPRAAPELALGGAAAAAVVTLGGLAVMLGRRRRKTR